MRLMSPRTRQAYPRWTRPPLHTPSPTLFNQEDFTGGANVTIVKEVNIVTNLRATI